MTEEEDFNTFDSHDCGGAVLMLGIVPAVMAYVFDDHNVVLAALFAGIAVVIAAAVWGLSLITHWRIIPRLVSLAGAVLTPLYVALAVYLWCNMD